MTDEDDDTKEDDTESERRAPGYLWEWADDTCKVCGTLVGAGLRFMHVGRCEGCKVVH